MHETTQFGRAIAGNLLDIVVGFDFGTSCTKVVFRAPLGPGGPAGLAFAVDFDELGHKTCSSLLPSVVWMDSAGGLSLARGEGKVLLRDIKYHLMRNEKVSAVPSNRDAEGVDARIASVAFISMALKRAREWFLATHVDVFGEFDIRWSFNLGVPSADCKDSDLCTTYQIVAAAAWALSTRDGSPTVTAASDALDSSNAAEGLSERDLAEVHLIPEVAAEVVGYARSAARRDGLHILIDVGATTLDVCGFILHRQDGDDEYALLTADVKPLGASFLYKTRVDAVAKSVEAHLASLWNEYDPVSPMSSEVSEYAPRHESVDASLRSGDDEYLGECRRTVFSTIVDLKTTRYPTSSCWDEAVPMFLSGGGSAMPFYSEELMNAVSERLKSLYIPCRGLQVLTLDRPARLEAEKVDAQTYHRFAVAWGLSYLDTDIGNVVRPSEIGDISPPEVYDWGNRVFISKDMV